MEKLRIVVVEDEYYVRKGIIQSFDWEKVDCEIVGEAANGKAGIEVVEETKPDLVIVDVEMPVMDGLEMVRHLKSRKCMAEFVFLTAHQQFTYIHSALKLEAVDYLLKPFRFEDLEECIRKVRLKVHKADTPLEEQILFSKELQVKNSYIKNAVTYVRKHYAEEISSVMVAEELDINPAYFCRLFKKETGQCLIGIPAIDCLLSSKQLQSASALLCLTHRLRTSVNSCSSHGDHSCCSNHSFFQKHNYLKPLIRYRCPK